MSSIPAEKASEGGSSVKEESPQLAAVTAKVRVSRFSLAKVIDVVGYKYGLAVLWILMIVVFSVLRPASFMTRANFAVMFGSQASTIVLALALVVALAGLCRQMRELRIELRVVFTEVEVVATPAVADATPRTQGGGMIPATAGATRFTHPWSVANVRAVLLPYGFATGRLPIGLQLAGGTYSMGVLCGPEITHQEATDWHPRRPLKTLIGKE